MDHLSSETIMVVGLVTPYFPDENTTDSGIANHNFILANALANNGIKVVVLQVRPEYYKNEPALKEEKINQNLIKITCTVANSFYINQLFRNKWAVLDFLSKIKVMLTASRMLKKLSRQFHIDVIEASSYFSLTYFYNPTNIPIILRVSTLFKQILTKHSPFQSRLLNLIAKAEISQIIKGKYLVTHAVDHAKELSEAYGIKNEFEIIPHGINLPELPQNTLEKTNRILYAGRLEYRKGIDILLKSIPLVLEKYPDAIFDIVGNDPDHNYQKNFEAINPENIIKKVRFRGKISQNELNDAYLNCDIFVAPSRYESFGLVFIEAMSYGKPVIGAEVGGIPEIIDDRVNGLFFENENHHDLADKLVLLLLNPQWGRELGQNGRKKVEQTFSEKTLAEKSIAFYKKVIHSN